MNKPILVDSHCHLDYLDRKGDLQDAIKSAPDYDVHYMQTISTSMTTFPKVLEIANNHKNIFASTGVHPCHVTDHPLVSYDELLEATKHDKVIGLGESGIDLFHDKTTLELQEQSFRIHIEVARDTGIPVIVHTRNADEDTIRILKDEYEKGAFPALIHCFSAGHELAEQSIAMGFYISLSGIITFPKGAEVCDIVKDLPIDRLLVETDSPYLAPIPYRGKPNQPAYTKHTAEKLAEVMGVNYLTIANQTTENFFTLFKKAVR
ncbi:MAG: TatD family hydrolase [Alphaproteobacteria bacterium]